jgi:hypothetical protein
MSKRNYKRLIDQAKTKALKGQQVLIPGKIVAHTPEEVAKNFGKEPLTTIETGPGFGEVDAYADAILYALELGNTERLEWLMNNEVEMPQAFLPLLFKALTSKAPAGEQSPLTSEAKIRLCIEMNLRARKEEISHARVFSETAEKYGLAPKTIERWWDEVNEMLAPEPGFITLHRKIKKSKKLSDTNT